MIALPPFTKPCLFLLVFIALGLNLWAQPAADSKADSLRTLATSAGDKGNASDKWLELSKHYRKTNLDSSQATLTRAIDAAKASGDADRQTRCQMSQGALHWMRGDFKSAEKNYLLALAYWQKKGASVEVARCLLNLGNVCQAAHKDREAAAYLRTAIGMASLTGEHLIQAQSAGVLATVFYQLGQPDSIGKYSDIAEQGFRALNDSANLARVNANLGFYYRELGMSVQARQPFLNAIEYIKGTDELGLIGEVHSGFGLLEYKVGNFNEAIPHFITARDCYIKLKWHKKIADSENVLGLCYKELGRTGTALAHFEEAYRLSDSISNLEVAASSLLAIADVRREQKAQELALGFYRQALDKTNQTPFRQVRYGCLLGISKSMSALMKLDSAGHYLDLALEEAEEKKDQAQIADCQLERGSLSLQQLNYDAALAEVGKAMKNYQERHDAKGLNKAWILRGKIHEAKGDLREALKAERMASQWKDSVQAFSAYDQLLALEAKYWSERKQHDLDMALQNELISSKEAERAEANTSKVAAQRNLLITVFGLLLVFAVSAFYITKKARQNRVDRKLSELRMVALRAQMNPHFIFNALGSVQLLINTNAIREANLYLSRFAQLLRLTLERSGDSESSLHDELEALKLYIDLEALRFKFQYEIQVDPSLPSAELRFPTLLLQPIVENAVKHGLSANPKAGQLLVRVIDKGTEILCQIEDNGVGRKASRKRAPMPGEERKSFGLQITRERLGLLSPGQTDRMTIVDLQDANGQPTGTRVDILIPKQKII